MNIILCGYMGSGKSLIGKKLAEKRNMTFLDLDEEIVKNENMEIADIFSQKGEINFRKTEMQVLKTCVENAENTVLALGGGTPCYGQNLQLIKEAPDTVLVYLKMNLEALTNRLFNERLQRPLIRAIADKESLKDYIRKHLFERQFYYMQSDFKVDCSTREPQAIVQEIADGVEQ